MSKTSEKICEYRDLQIEISRCWSMNKKVVPIVVGALGTVGKDLGLKLFTLPGLPKMYKIQKTALMTTAHILRKVLARNE